MTIDLTQIRDVVSTSAAGSVVLELEAVVKNAHYRMVGICMRITNTEIRLAFNAKGDVVLDDVTLPISTVVSARLVDVHEIEVLE